MEPDKQKKKLPQNFEESLRPHVWLPGVSGNPNGRPRKFMTQMKATGYKRVEVLDSIKALLACTVTELKEIAQDGSATVLERTVANALGMAMVAGNLQAVEVLLNRAYGAPKETTETLHQFVGPMQIEIIGGGPPIASTEIDVTDVEPIL